MEESQKQSISPDSNDVDPTQPSNQIQEVPAEENKSESTNEEKYLIIAHSNLQVCSHN